MSDDLILKQRFIRFLEKEIMNEEEKNNILNNPELLKISSLDIPLDIAEIAEEFINDELSMEKEYRIQIIDGDKIKLYFHADHVGENCIFLDKEEIIELGWDLEYLEYSV